MNTRTSKRSPFILYSLLDKDTFKQTKSLILSVSLLKESTASKGGLHDDILLYYRLLRP